MEIIKKEYQVYQFDELSEEAQDKAINRFYDINVDYEWYDLTLDDIKAEWGNKYGLSFKTNEVYFDLDRGSYLYFKDLDIVDSGKLAIAIYGKGYNLLVHNGLISFRTYNQYYGGGSGRTHLEIDDYRDSNCKDFDIDCDDWLHDKTEDLLSTLRREYEYLTSREAIIDTIKANEYNFLEDGTLFNC